MFWSVRWRLLCGKQTSTLWKPLKRCFRLKPGAALGAHAALPAEPSQLERAIGATFEADGLTLIETVL
jgi:hypothetical protein